MNLRFEPCRIPQIKREQLKMEKWLQIYDFQLKPSAEDPLKKSGQDCSHSVVAPETELTTKSGIRMVFQHPAVLLLGQTFEHLAQVLP
ncbi:MAG: hypothetical protein WB424_19515 [Terracidiphilus sp.]